MQTELEAKFLHIDIDQMRRRLTAIGASLVHPERLMRRRNYHSDEFPGWVRVRDEGGHITMTYKQVNDRTLQGTKEINLTIDDFDAACLLLETIGLTRPNYQETKRESWTLGDVEIELDTWPWVDPLIELEGHSEADLKSVASKLELDWSKALHGSVEVAYQDEYDVTEPEISAWTEITFSPVPAWLARKRHKEPRS